MEWQRGARQEAWLGLSLLMPRAGALIWEALANGIDPCKLWRELASRYPYPPLAAVRERTRQAGARIVTWDDETYPALLRQISMPPPVLYWRGELLASDEVAIAIVGSRRASALAVQLAYHLGYDLASLGVTIVSGLALGIDAAAHQGALAAQGRTIAVLAAGLDWIYPRCHTALAERITGQGVIFSQFPCGVGVQRRHFAIRNRLLAGLALGTIVVEAGARSGALLTAGFALDHGREVLVCPGHPLRKEAEGSNALLRDGARAIRHADDVLADLQPELRNSMARLERGRDILSCVSPVAD